MIKHKYFNEIYIPVPDMSKYQITKETKLFNGSIVLKKV